MREKKNTAERRGARRGKGERRGKWVGRLAGWAVALSWVAMHIVVFELGGRTIADLPFNPWWVCVLATLLAVIAGAVSAKKPDKGVFILSALMGFFGGMFLLLLWGTVFLGLNYLFPRSAPYRREAVVYDKEEVCRGRGPTRHYVKLRFTDGRRYSWNADHGEFGRFRKGDTCTVTLYEGLWGSEVIQDVEVATERPFPVALLRLAVDGPGLPDERALHALGRDARTVRYGLPLSVRQVTGRDMGGEFRVRLLDHAAPEEIDSGQRVFVECTWNLGLDDRHAGQRLTCWYEWRDGSLHPVDSLLWDADEEF